jgi:hypothetical protein
MVVSHDPAPLHSRPWQGSIARPRAIRFVPRAPPHPALRPSFFIRDGGTYEVPLRTNKHRGPVVDNPAYQLDGFGASNIDAYEVMGPAAAAVPVRRVDSDTNDIGKKQPKPSSAPRWMVVAVIIALLLGVVAIALGFLSNSSDSGGNAVPATSAPTIPQVGSSVRSDLAALQTQLNEYANNMSALQQVVQAQSALVQTQSENLSHFHQVVQDQAATIAALQFQLSLNTTSTSSPTHLLSLSPTHLPSPLPSTAPTFLPTWQPSQAPSISPTSDAILPAVVASARQMGTLLTNGTFIGDFSISVPMFPLTEHIVELQGRLNLNDAAIVVSFPRLQHIKNDLQVTGTSVLENFSFPVLRTVGGDIRLTRNTRLRTLADAFPVLENVTGELWLTDNAALADLGSSFSHLTRIRGFLGSQDTLSVYGNALGFCSNYAARLCPTPAVWSSSGASDGSALTCCTQFCSTSPLC